MSSSSSTHSSHLENIANAGIIATLSVFGLFSNTAAIVAVLYSPILRNAFGRLCLSHSFCNLGVLLISTFWLAPNTFRERKLSIEVVDKIMGLINTLLWYVCIYSHFAISLNRVVALIMPLQAELLNRKKSIWLVLVVWLIGFCHITPFFWGETCYIHYETSVWMWLFADTTCGNFLSTYIDSYTGFVLLSATIVLDIISVIKLKGIQKRPVTTTNSMQRKRHEVERRFLKQTLCQNLLFLYAILSYYYVSTRLTNHWALFCSTTLPGLLLHAFDGFIIAVFHFHLSYLKSTFDLAQKAIKVIATKP
ncbi:unnamed protein product [Cylicocyclus nassatus]|uniref:G-protein coupled receptors family 1 profile domain-containing protein n=1 Tax=Cylicocyclus nassatus TaxID=53992 RepID=A0AA36DLY8_CYLNA|nr:unnamed protein product [Cylicocyclus nassatus]